MPIEKQSSEAEASVERPRKTNTEIGRIYGGAAKSLARPTGPAAATENVGHAVQKQGEALVEWIKARPVTSFAIGAAVGALIGVAIGLRIRG